MLRRIIHFVQYHNFFTLAVMALFLGASASLAASPELQKSVLSSEETVRSVDNTFVVTTDFDAFSAGLTVSSVVEDAERYYVGYTYSTVEVQDYVWKPSPVDGTLTVSKKELAGKDLGLYVAEQLGQVVGQQTAYLKEVQKNEREKGATQKVVAVEYSGLIGQFLNTKENVFPGYQPVKPPVRPEPREKLASVASAPELAQAQTVESPAPSITQDDVERMIQERVEQILAEKDAPANTEAPADAPSETVPPVEEVVEPVAPAEEPESSTPPTEEPETSVPAETPPADPVTTEPLVQEPDPTPATAEEQPTPETSTPENPPAE